MIGQATAVGPQSGIDRAAWAGGDADRCGARLTVGPTPARAPSKRRCSALPRLHCRFQPAGQSGAGGAIRSRDPRSASLRGPGSSSVQWRRPRRSPRPSPGAKCEERGMGASSRALAAATLPRGQVWHPIGGRGSTASRLDSRAHGEAKALDETPPETHLALGPHSMVPRGTSPARQATEVAGQLRLS